MPRKPLRGLFVGLTTLDIFYRLENTPRPNSKNIVQDQLIYAGGPAANAAVAFAALGGEATLYTALGRHPLASLARADLVAHGVKLIDSIPTFDGLPAIASIGVSPNGDRLTLCRTKTSRPTVTPSAFPDAPPAIVLADGYLPELAVAAAGYVRSCGAPLVLDCEGWKPAYEDVLPAVDAAICGEDFRPPGCENPTDALRYVAEHGVRRRAVTQGERSLLWEEDDRSGSLSPPAVEAVDTLGAGDIFHGAYCYYAAALPDAEFAEQLSKASAVASLSCEFFGTREWIRRLPEHIAATTEPQP